MACFGRGPPIGRRWEACDGPGARRGMRGCRKDFSAASSVSGTAAGAEQNQSRPSLPPCHTSFPLSPSMRRHAGAPVRAIDADPDSATAGIWLRGVSSRHARGRIVSWLERDLVSVRTEVPPNSKVAQEHACGRGTTTGTCSSSGCRRRRRCRSLCRAPPARAR